MLDLFLNRRSVRKFKNQKVDQKIIDDILAAALTAPSGRNAKPWELVVVTDKNILAKLANARSHAASFVKDAAFAIVVLADPAITDLWIEDASIMATVIQLATQASGLSSCWAQVRERENQAGDCVETLVKDILQVPDQYRVECVLAIGYPDEEKSAYDRDNLPYDRVHYNSF